MADATALSYADDSFDAVLIANALHVMPEPEKALREIDRALRLGGILIAPNSVEHQTEMASRIWSGVLRLAGVSFEHQLTSQEQFAWLEAHGWRVTLSTCVDSEAALQKSGVNYEQILGDGLFHCYPVFPIVKEAGEGWRQMVGRMIRWRDEI